MKSIGQIVLENTSRNQESAQTEVCKDGQTHTKKAPSRKQCAPLVSHWAGHKKIPNKR